MQSYVPESIAVYTVAVSAVFSVIFASLVACAFALVEGGIQGFFKSMKAIWPTLATISIPVGLVAYIAGYLTVFSRAPAVGTLVPAVLALIGGLNIYVFGSDTKHKALVGYCVCLFSIMLFYGTQYGAYKRDSDRIARLMEDTRQEVIIRSVRKHLKLPDDLPPWIISSEPGSK